VRVFDGLPFLSLAFLQLSVLGGVVIELSTADQPVGDGVGPDLLTVQYLVLVPGPGRRSMESYNPERHEKASTWFCYSVP
jgi:hypothetical protein